MSTDNGSGLRASHAVGPVSCERCEHLSAGLRTTGLNPNRASPKRPREILYETVVTREIHNPVSIPTNPRLRNPCTKLWGHGKFTVQRSHTPIPPDLASGL